MISNLTLLSSTVILDKTKVLVSEERRISTEILWHIREIEFRRLFSEMGYGSMFEMLTQYFGYSEGSAHRRLSAARLLKELPEIEPALKEGRLTLTTISLADGFFRNEKKSGKPYSVAAKHEVLKTLEGKSRLETEKALAARSPEAPRPEQLRTISETVTELRITLNEAQLEKLKKLKFLFSHKNPNLSFAELIEHLADTELKRVDPASKPTPSGGVKRNEKIGNTRSRYVPVHLKTRIWRRAQGHCEYVDRPNGTRCTSRFMLELDHEHPFSMGGETNEANLRLLCRNHNVHAAFKALGPRTMNRYLASSQRPNVF